MELAKTVGALPVIKQICEKLRLAQILDEIIPLAPQAAYARGEVLVALIMNKLTSPQPLYLLETWAADSGAEALLGIPAEALTDDRVAALLDDIAENVENLKREVCLSAIERFGLDVGRFHWDLTSLSFEGDYDSQHPLWPLITYGYDPRGSGKQKQVRVAQVVVGDGAVGGLLHKTYAGNTSDLNTVTDYIGLFCEIRDRFGQQPRLVGDTKLVSQEKMADLADAGLEFICPEPRLSDLEDHVKRLSAAEWKQVAYVSRREANRAEADRTVYRAVEEPVVKTIKRASAPGDAKAAREYTFRRLFVSSSEERGAQRQNRERDRKRTEDDLRELKRKLRGAYWKKKPEEEARAAAKRLADKRSVGKLYQWSLKAHVEGGWDLTFQLDQQALERAEKLDGYYTLVTNTPLSQASSEEVFTDWKQQNDVERRFGDWKGPLKVRPLFIKSNKRVVGLVAVLSFALLVFSLIEREVRRKLRESDEAMVGLLPVKRPVRATGRNIIRSLSSLNLVCLTFQGRRYWQMPPPNPVQKRLLELMEIDVNRMLALLNARRLAAEN